MNIGDVVLIRPESEHYFSPKYINTTATIVRIYGDDIYDVKTFDNQTFIAHGQFLVSKLQIPPAPNTCEHRQARKTIISRTLKYYFCPDCKQDVGPVHD